jgi:dephospho-CoA kinase
MLEKRGWPVLYADRIAIELEETRPSVRKAIKKLVGEDAYLGSGKLNKPFIASRIFSRKTLQRAIERIVHPMVIGEISQRIKKYGKLGAPIVAVEAALLFESGMRKHLDAVVVVSARENLRIRRVTKRDGVKPVDVRKRMKAQWPEEKKVRQADFVLGNNGTLKNLRTRVDLLMSLITALSQGSNHVNDL